MIDDYDDIPDTGPFCRHYSSPIDCEEVCVRCCHACRRHGSGPCTEDGCTCEGFTGDVFA